MLGFSALAVADEITFTTLPQPIQTTVIRETHIPDASSVTRVVRDGNGVYAVTVHQSGGERVVYVNGSGTIVENPQTTTTTTVQTRQQPVVQDDSTTITTSTQQVQQNSGRYQLIEKKGKKEIYLDRQTGQKVTVKREND